MQAAFPERKLPGFKSSRKQKSEHVNSVLRNINVCGDGKCSTLDSIADLLCVIEANIKAIFEFSTAHDPTKDNAIPPTFGTNNIITISLAMNSDGVRIVNSKKRLSGHFGSVCWISLQFCDVNLLTLCWLNCVLVAANLTGMYFLTR